MDETGEGGREGWTEEERGREERKRGGESETCMQK